MVAKILTSSKTFSAVQYNTNKMQTNAGELMKAENFGLLDVHNLSPQFVKDYLMKLSSYGRVKNPQFHATISTKGKDHTKEELTDVAEKWLTKMGYGENPYLIIFHNDTDNNHVHIVTTRVDYNGKKVNDSYEKYKAVQYINELVPSKKTEINNLKDLMSFNYSSIPQFSLLLEDRGYTITDKGNQLSVYEHTSGSTDLYKENIIQNARTEYSDKELKSMRQISELIKKYQKIYDPNIIPIHMKLKAERKGKVIGYESDLTDFLNKKFGLKFKFHFKDDKQPYGYTIIDYRNKSIYKGSEILKLRQMIGGESIEKYRLKLDERRMAAAKFNIEGADHVNLLTRKFKLPIYEIDLESQRRLSKQELNYYKDLLSSYSGTKDLKKLRDLNIEVMRENGKLYLLDHTAYNIIEAKKVLDNNSHDQLDLEEQISSRISIDFSTDIIPALAAPFVFEQAEDEDALKKGKKKKRNLNS